MKLPMVLLAFGPALFLGFLVSFAQALVNLFDDEANIEPSHRLSGLGPRDLPPNYGPPTYDYGSPPPYGYETPALTTTVTVSSDYSTFTTSVTSKKTKLVTVTNQPHLTSGEYTTLTNTLTVTKSGGAGSESASVSTKSDSWVKSSALGVTGTSTASRSTEWESSSSAETEATSSEMVTGPRSSLGHASTATITFTFVTSESSTLASIDKGTSTKPNTASVPQQTTRTDSVISSRSSFETSSLPSTANVSSNDGDSTASATSNSVATITWIVTSTRNGDANASSNPEPEPTTFSTSVRDSETSTESGPGSGRGSSRHPQSTNRLGSKPEASLPNNPNFPWGSDSPIHRHQSVAQLGAGMVEGGIWRRWAKKTIQKLKAYLA
ncbi:hypothetical protein NOR_01846 [Metarhizium rileyi]|uniref:Uncharacterized protein n=1 Tax=Metarhizium rileyi (strain RCEF 4871) TaxID=1649241 RepID=A0A167I2F2_METRR|nr:hypothetical protein NOR_01846 [Metarhizium rileyi RCEF 4871]